MQVNSKDKNRKWVAADNAEVITSSVIQFFLVYGSMVLVLLSSNVF
jgi:hypothetical protein